MESFWNPVEHLVEFFVEIVVFRLLAISAEELHCACLTGFKMRLCPITYYIKDKIKRQNLGLTLHPHFTSLKLCKCSEIPDISTRVASTPGRTKTNHHWLNHLQILYMR